MAGSKDEQGEALANGCLPLCRYERLVQQIMDEVDALPPAPPAEAGLPALTRYRGTTLALLGFA